MSEVSRQTDNSAQRRAYFRIDDKLGVHYTVFAASDTPNLADYVLQGGSSARKHLDNQWHTIQQALTHLIDKVHHRDRDLGRALRLMDEKMQLLAQQSVTQASTNPAPEPLDVNISAGGIAFPAQAELAAGTLLGVTIQLLPSNSVVHAIAEVVMTVPNPHPTPELPYVLRLNFTELSEEDRNLIVRHTLNRQAELLREQKLAQAASL